MATTKIKWNVLQVEVSKIKPTPNNFKLKTEEGLARFNTSVASYGLAGVVVLNADFTLIDGNTRLEKAKEIGMKKVWASIPDRKLTVKEFNEFSAMFDFAKAGDVDLKRIQDELGTTEQFFKKWGMDMPKAALDKLAQMEKEEKVVNPTGARKIAEEAKEIQTRPITLLFTVAEAAEYLKLAESLYASLKVDNVTDATMAVTRQAVKNKKKFKAGNHTDLAMKVIKDATKSKQKPKRK